MSSILDGLASDVRNAVKGTKKCKCDETAKAYEMHSSHSLRHSAIADDIRQALNQEKEMSFDTDPATDIESLSSLVQLMKRHPGLTITLSMGPR